MRKTVLILTVIFFTIFMFFNCNKNNSTENDDTPPVPETVTDIDGNTYQTVKIGNQVWMAENLKVTHYRSGDAIPNVTDNTDWILLTTSAYCNYDNNVDNVATYGRLYNWYAVNDSHNIAPVDWHVPTYAELQTLVDFLDCNVSGFPVIYGGSRNNDENGTYEHLGNLANFWSCTEFNNAHAWYLLISSGVDYFADFKHHGYSVRCAMD